MFWSSHTFLDPSFFPSHLYSFLPSFLFSFQPQSPSLIFQPSVWGSVTYMGHPRNQKVLTAFLDFQETCLNGPLLPPLLPPPLIWKYGLQPYFVEVYAQRLLFPFGCCAYSSGRLFFVISAVRSISPRPLISVPSCGKLAHLLPVSWDMTLLWTPKSSKSGLFQLYCACESPAVFLNADSHSIHLDGL